MESRLDCWSKSEARHRTASFLCIVLSPTGFMHRPSFLKDQAVYAERPDLLATQIARAFIPNRIFFYAYEAPPRTFHE